MHSTVCTTRYVQAYVTYIVYDLTAAVAHKFQVFNLTAGGHTHKSKHMFVCMGLFFLP